MSSPAKVNPNVEILRAYFASPSAENKQQAQEAFERIMTGIDNAVRRTKEVIEQVYYLDFRNYHGKSIYLLDEVYPNVADIWRLLGNDEPIPNPYESEDERYEEEDEEEDEDKDEEEEEDAEEPPTKAAKTE